MASGTWGQVPRRAQTLGSGRLTSWPLSLLFSPTQGTGLAIGRMVMTGEHELSAHASHVIQLILRTRNQPAQGLGANLWITVVFQDSSQGYSKTVLGPEWI